MLQLSAAWLCYCTQSQTAGITPPGISAGDMTPSRTSCSTFLTNSKASHPDIQCFEERVSQLTSLPALMGGRKPLTKGEAVQVVR